MNVTPDLVVTVERVRIFQEATDVNADQGILEATAKFVSVKHKKKPLKRQKRNFLNNFSR